jgi:predicted aldo/keto reductase-like oxidoreductase
MSKKTHLGRRRFLKESVFGLFSASIATKGVWARIRESTRADSRETKDKSQPKIKAFRILGRTGFKVSDLAIGRKSIFITTKMEVKKDPSKEDFLKRSRKALEELDTEYIDCMMMHCPEKAETLKTEAFHAAMQQLKSEGRLRYVGVSNHGSFWFKAPEEPMHKVLLAAADDGRFDVFLMSYNFLQMDQAEQVLEVCKEKDIGTALMKSTPVHKYFGLKSRVEQLKKEKKEINPFYKEGLARFKDKYDRAEQFIKKYDLKSPEEIREAAIRFVLENPNVNTVCCSLKTYDELERILPLSGSKLSDWERKN